MSHREYFVQANRSDDKPTHNSSGAFDETSDRILQWQRAVKRKMPDAILESNPAFLVDVQQRLNCALSASFLWALISFDSRVLTAYPMDDQLIHPRELAVDLFNRSQINPSAMNLSLERR